MNKKQINLHLVSDSTGETLGLISKAVLSQFEGFEFKIYTWGLVRNSVQIEAILQSIQQNPGIVVYTIIEGELEERLRQQCKELSCPCIAAIQHIITSMQDYLHVQNIGMSGRQHIIDNDYYRQIEAIEYTIAHDDGNHVDETLCEADIILLGVSRTSKTPTSIYLSHKGFKVANIPLVGDEAHVRSSIEDVVAYRKNVFIVGFAISSERLLRLREARLRSFRSPHAVDTNYTSLSSIEDELRVCSRIFNALDIPVINVTQKSVEEVCVFIVKMYERFADRLGLKRK